MGQCFGVRDAIALTRTVAALQPVTVLGELVHNEAVLADLRARGVRVERDLAEAKTETVVLTAHGTSERRRSEVSGRGHHIVDATCPLVRVAHQALADLVSQGLHPVVIGQRGHVEVCGLTEDYPNCDIILSEADVARLTPRARFGVVSQTTQPLARVQELVARLRQQFPNSEVVFRNTVCQPTQHRQTAAERLAQQCDVVVVIGGVHSNNTRELVNTSGYFCDRVYHIQSAADLDPDWFNPGDTIGLTAGTSTPDNVIQAVESRLRQWCLDSEQDYGARVQVHASAS
jgi:4-hydroxy-3-methylbut-2-enyl diphosphate reductase